MNNTEIIIKIENLSKRFGKLKVLDGLNLSVQKGTMLALLGPNGAGKTTTIKILSTLLAPDSGKATVNGYDVVCNPQGVRKSIGLTGQYAAVDEYLSGKENLELIGRLYHLSKRDAKRRSAELLERFNLIEAAHRAVRTYSGGMRRKLDLAASLIASPPVIFLDEPTTGLDPRSRLATWEIIREMMKADTTILLTTQQLEEADHLANKIAVIHDGNIIAEGTSDQLKLRVGQQRLEFIVKSENDLDTFKKTFTREIVSYESERMAVSLQSDGSISSIKSNLNRVEDAGISIETFSIRKPALDDVFLYYTGHKAENSQTGD
ncbi:ATP-binding cassette domain-containing protein [Chitinispirillales bacterium ANBcel5]|uniref:ATP-binding cassette domain-containing protein n=1 Tax=Cellulosispirillum alkaliphilum TaxID=3039283 RepID=UPI002A5455FE|nr:ATP-binding cassette domain-containing protein [Chitinispirillales bacterium ANBcel5]